MKRMNFLIALSVSIAAYCVKANELADGSDEGDSRADGWIVNGEVSWDDASGSFDLDFVMRSAPNIYKTITLDVYYESMCPYSRRFVTNQLAPASSKLKDYVHVNFVPYGNAIMKMNEDGETEVRCQHGINECVGNKIHACAIERLQSNQQKVGFVSCVMQSPDPKIGGLNCSEPFGLSWEDLEFCAANAEGDALHQYYGQNTMNLNPPNKGVPTTAVNKNRGTDDDQRQMKENLFLMLCQKLWEMSIRPKECGSNGRNRRMWFFA
ncbi:hypothetical protein GE061_000638 [Apolygus lucorum]|uniref:Gamma-interferon inducible lysosomal thiol reductase n=1 Tax=Apolygus lucorum TaxID=248454 RepID=A0A6A4KH02_APOLU|nr:hypothetical protein GE061_000638 [Apolygus lucorum]